MLGPPSNRVDPDDDVKRGLHPEVHQGHIYANNVITVFFVVVILTRHFMCLFRSSGCRVITRHLSITDGIGKRREIVVPGKAKPKEKEKKNKEKSQGPICSRGLRNIN